MVKQQRPKGIRKTPYGYQAYCWVHGHMRSKRFSRNATIGEMRTWRNQRKVADDLGVTLAPAPGVTAFETDVSAYEDTIAAMPSASDRVRDIRCWLPVFGVMPRTAITSMAIATQRDRWLTVGPRRLYDRKLRKYINVRKPLMPSSVNHRLTALRHFFTTIDPHAPNPAADVVAADESGSGAPRDIDLPVALTIVRALPRGVDNAARLRVMAWTGWPHSMIKRIEPQHIDWKAGAIWMPPRRKGRKRPSTQPGCWLPLLPQAIAALREMKRLGCWGPFSNSALHKYWRRHLWRLMRAEKIPVGTCPRPYDLRHTFATTLATVTTDERALQRLLMSAQPRYSQRATDPRLQVAIRQLAAYFRLARTGKVPGGTQRNRAEQAKAKPAKRGAKWPKSA